MLHGGGVLFHSPFQILLQPAKKFFLRNNTVLDYLGHPRPYFPLVKGLQGGKVGHHHCGLIKGAYYIFAPGVVYRHLPTHTAVHLGQQCGGYLHKGHSPEVGGGHKTRQIPHHTSSQGNNGSFSVKLTGIRQVIYTLGCRKGFVFLSIGNLGQHGGYPGLPQTAEYFLTV